MKSASAPVADLAAIIEEGERQIRSYTTMILPHGDARTLLAVARAAVEAERLTAIFRRDYITAPPDADSTAWTQRAWAASGEADDAIERLFAAARGEAEKKGEKP